VSHAAVKSFDRRGVSCKNAMFNSKIVLHNITIFVMFMLFNIFLKKIYILYYNACMYRTRQKITPYDLLLINRQRFKIILYFMECSEPFCKTSVHSDSAYSILINRL